MPSDGELEAAQLAQIEADLAELSAHVAQWIQGRFLTADDAANLNLEDVLGLIAWLEQWHAHFDGYGETAASLAEAGRPTMQARLAQIRTEIDSSIATFTEMGDTLPKPGEG